MTVKQLILFFIIALITLSSDAKNILITDIEKDPNNNWTVTYTSKKPVTSIQFAITKDDSREQRWQILSEGFEFQSMNGKDTIFRRDGQTFTQVIIQLTASYIHLPKYYAPFAPFSEGSMLFHSARFFACPQLCSGFENIWYIRVTAPEDELILVNGMQVRQQASWYDANDGTKVYVGKLSVAEVADLIAVIDPALPDYVQKPLNSFLPKAFKELSKQLKPLKQKPMLFASFGETSDGRYGRQGGVLPNQIFMHWYGKKPAEDVFDLLWFYAHEATHIFQRFEQANIEEHNAWIHEGHAEYIAANLLLKYYPESKQYVAKRIERAEQVCKQALSQYAIEDFAQQQQYQSLYQCGLYFYSMIANSSEFQHQSAFMLWRAIVAQADGKEINRDAVLAVSEKLVDKEHIQAIKKEMGWQGINPAKQ